MKEADENSDAARLLECLERFRDLDARVSLNSIVLFLHVCVEEGRTMKELAYLVRLPEATASRAARALEGGEAVTSLPPALGLLDFPPSGDGRMRRALLSSAGRALLRDLNGILRCESSAS